MFWLWFPCLRAGTSATLPLMLSGSNFTLVSGTAQNGIWQATLTMPRYSGVNWAFTQVNLSDAVTNHITLTSTQLAAMGISPLLTDSSAPSDTTPPTLTGLSITPPVADTSSSSQNITVTLSASDDISGVFFGLFNSTYFYVDAEFQSPSGNQLVIATQNYSHPAPIAGTPLAGTWQLTALWPQFSEEGTWNLNYLALQDTVGNSVFYTPAQNQCAALPDYYRDHETLSDA